MVARLLAHIDEFRIRTGMCKQLFTGQKVIDDDVRPLEGMQPLESNKAGIAGPRSDQIYVHSASAELKIQQLF